MRECIKTPIPSRVTTLGVHLGQIRTRGDRPQSPKEWIKVSLFIRHDRPLPVGSMTLPTAAGKFIKSKWLPSDSLE